ncbi:hypothetical protein KFU94_15865 [Chloroflexi bacterium TSY]|nr:hypothetical protein [Chloroflexi bacterium TSY]
MIHSAQYIEEISSSSTPWADSEQGWGRVDLQTVLAPDAPQHVQFHDVRNGLPQGESHEYTLTLQGSGEPFRITLVYTDVDVPSGDIVNDLDLLVTGPDGSFYFGNDFTQQGVPDADNNVEGILIPNAAAGQWTVQVIGTKVPQGPQDYALVISGHGIGKDVIGT